MPLIAVQVIEGKSSRLYSAYSGTSPPIYKFPLSTSFRKFWVNTLVVSEGFEVLIVPELWE